MSALEDAVAASRQILDTRKAVDDLLSERVRAWRRMRREGMSPPQIEEAMKAAMRAGGFTESEIDAAGVTRHNIRSVTGRRN